MASAAPHKADQLGDTRFQGRDLGRLRLDQCNQFFPRWLAWRLRIHESLNRNKIPLSRKNFRFDREKLAALPGQ
jgi:hypothetical protein